MEYNNNSSNISYFIVMQTLGKYLIKCEFVVKRNIMSVYHCTFELLWRLY